MKMISVDDIIEFCHTEIAALSAYGNGVATSALRRVIEFAKENVIEAEPVKQWYSTEENQPDSVGDDVLIVDKRGKYHIAYYLSSSENWMNQDTGEPIKDAVRWRYLDGDSE